MKDLFYAVINLLKCFKTLSVSTARLVLHEAVFWISIKFFECVCHFWGLCSSEYLLHNLLSWHFSIDFDNNKSRLLCVLLYINQLLNILKDIKEKKGPHFHSWVFLQHNLIVYLHDINQLVWIGAFTVSLLQPLSLFLWTHN